MRLLLKALAAPIVVLLTVFVWLCALLLNLSAAYLLGSER